MPLKTDTSGIRFNARYDGNFNKPFAEQVDFFRQKLNVPTEHYDDILKSAHDRAFMVAGAMTADLLNDFRSALDLAIANGDGLPWFKKQFDAIVAKHGWEYTGSRDWRSRVIYTTNLQASYAAGRYRQLTDPDLLASRPYWRYVHNDTVRHPRPLHLKWGQIPVVLKHDDPWWQSHYPPNGWGCRCRIEAVRAKDYPGDPAPDDGKRTVKDRYGNTHSVPNGIDYGWDYAPGSQNDTSLRDMVQQKLIRYPEAITSALSRSINKYINAHDKPQDFAARALADRQLDEVLWLGFVENAEKLQSTAGIDVKGYTITLPSWSVRHVETTHGDDQRNQRAPTTSDYNMITEWLAQFDEAYVSPQKSKHGNQVLIVWASNDSERARITFEILKGKKNRSLALKTLLFRKEK